MVYLFYLVVAALIVYCSNKASEYVDLIDKKSSLSGAFIGGVILSAVTSLPELFTSISSTLFLNKPGLCIGNILGSDLFNLAILAFLMLLFFHSFGKAQIAKSHTKLTLAVALIYGVLMLNWFGFLQLTLATVSITSLLIFLLYAIGVKYMSAENGEEPIMEPEECNHKLAHLSVKQISIRFVIVSLLIIGLSILITFLTDNIAARLNLGTGMAGAIFLGIATSLPEVSSTIALFRLGNYNIAIGNIIGSNIFNFMILSITDVLYTGQGLYDFSDPKTVNLLVFGAIATPILLGMMIFKNRLTQVVCPLCVIACYLAFLWF